MGRGAPARGAKSKKIDPSPQASVPLSVYPSATARVRASRSRFPTPTEGVTKRRTNTRSTRGRVNYIELNEDDDEEDPDDEYEEYPIHVALPDGPNITVSGDLNIDPALLETNTATDLGNISEDLELQQLQYLW